VVFTSTLLRELFPNAVGFSLDPAVTIWKKDSLSVHKIANTHLVYIKIRKSSSVCS